MEAREKLLTALDRMGYRLTDPDSPEIIDSETLLGALTSATEAAIVVELGDDEAFRQICTGYHDGVTIEAARTHRPSGPLLTSLLRAGLTRPALELTQRGSSTSASLLTAAIAHALLFVGRFLEPAGRAAGDVTRADVRAAERPLRDLATEFTELGTNGALPTSGGPDTAPLRRPGPRGTTHPWLSLDQVEGALEWLDQRWTATRPLVGTAEKNALRLRMIGAVLAATDAKGSHERPGRAGAAFDDGSGAVFDYVSALLTEENGSPPVTPEQVWRSNVAARVRTLATLVHDRVDEDSPFGGIVVHVMLIGLAAVDVATGVDADERAKALWTVESAGAQLHDLHLTARKLRKTLRRPSRR